MKGIVHMHSDFSYDGVDSIADIAAWARSKKLDFIALTEHDYGFDQEKYEKFSAECAAQSNGVLIMPGIEYSFTRDGLWLHTNILGIDQFLDNDTRFEKLPAFLDDVRARGGISILNHPANVIHLVSDELLAKFDLFELWNTKYDHDYAPNYRNLKILKRSRVDQFCIATSDIHQIPDGDFVLLDLSGCHDDPGEREILSALQQGRVTAKYRDWTIMSSGEIRFRSGWQRMLPLVSTSHKVVYDCLRSVARAVNYKPSKKLVRMLKGKS